jgi:ATP-binding cassette subfamily B (MDR/TAP) protein 1
LVAGTALFYGSAQLSERITMRLRSNMFEAILRREMSFFDEEENSIGALTTKLSDDSRVVSKATGDSLAKQLQAIFTLAVGISLGFTATWKVSAVVLATFPLNVMAEMVVDQQMTGQTNKDEKSGQEGAIISTAFSSMRTISAFSMQFKILEEYSVMTKGDSYERKMKAFKSGFGFGLAQATLFCTYALLFWYGSTLITAGELSFEMMMRALFCIMMGAMGMGAALNDMGDQKEGVLAAKRIFNTLDDAQKSTVDGLSISGLKPPSCSRGKIELKDIFFHYPSRPEIDVCKGYSLDINPGEVVALVGPSGSGKSTIINLLLRFYDPSSGSLFLDGQDIKSLNVRWLRSQIGYVGQEPVLFKGSVEENILWGLNDVDNSIPDITEDMLESDKKGIDFNLIPCLSKKESYANNISYDQGITNYIVFF